MATTTRFLMAALVLPMTLTAAETLDLAGRWRVDYGAGVTHEISLPGSLQANRLGDPITVETKWTGGIFDKTYFTAAEYAPYREPGNIKVPFWLQPETHFVGVATYERTIDLPPAWAGRRITLTLERPHWTTTVLLDGREVGSNNANSVAHVYELGTGVSPGQHVLTIRVDNRLIPDIGENSHSVSDHTQGNWNGIVGRIELTATATPWIETLDVFPDRAGGIVQVRGRTVNLNGQAWSGTVALRMNYGAGDASLVATAGADGSFVAEFPAERVPMWDEFAPSLCTITARPEGGESRDVRFGLREIKTEGRQLTINGRPLFLRGTLDCAAFPRTGHPPTDVAEWTRIMTTIKAHGLNHVRFHSWCPPEAAFVAADELGLYLQVEVASWPNWSTTLGDGKPVDAWTDAETARILRAYGNHPSFVLLCAGNEPGGDNHAAWLSNWVTRQKAADSRRLYTAGAGWPEVPENDYHIRSEPRIQQWLQGLQSRINALPPETYTDYGDFIRQRTAPVVSHEIGQWCVFPNFAEIEKYTGYLKPRNFEIFRASLEVHGLGAQAHDFLIASGKLQTLCYKEEIEAALRTPQMGGFQLLSLQDFPGQGTALVGVLDAFWEEKGYVTPAEFRRFCAATVPLARLAKRVFTADERLVAEFEVAHFGRAPLDRARPTWKLVADDGTTAAHGAFRVRDIAIGAARPLGRLELPLDAITAPASYKLVATLTAPSQHGANSETFENDWDIWIYPRADQVAIAPPADIVVAPSLDAATEARLAAGATVLLMIPPGSVAPDPRRGPIALGFSSIFWNTAWTNGQAPHSLGVLCDPRDPTFAQFPTDPWSNWQWWYPLSDAAPMIMDGLPSELRPTVQVVDDWFTNRKLGLVFEARVGQGKLLVTSIDLRDAVLDPVRRQLRASLLAYAASSNFRPTADVTGDQIRTLFRSERN